MGISPCQWHITATITINGYIKSVSCKNTYIPYSLKADILSVIEQDNDGFLLYQVDSKVEIIKPACSFTSDIAEKSIDKIFPALNQLRFVLNYVEHKKDKIIFYLGFKPSQLTSALNRTPISLILPDSQANQDFNKNNHYNQGIQSGSNSIELSDSIVLNRLLSKTEFNWTWNKKQQKWLHSQSVKLEIQINPKQ
jgi:hypothetical protein